MSYTVSMRAEKLHTLADQTDGWSPETLVHFLTQPDRTLITHLDRPVPGSTVTLTVTAGQVRSIADWAEAGRTMCPVELTASATGDDVTVAQGDVYAVIDADGDIFDPDAARGDA